MGSTPCTARPLKDEEYLHAAEQLLRDLSGGWLETRCDDCCQPNHLTGYMVRVHAKQTRIVM